ncbi:MAG: ribulose bisphosphate carboxylase small subunit [Cyanobacteria bacterium P01_F01_bin.33]
MPSSSTSSIADLQRSLELAIRQGSRLSLEIANPRQKARNSWRTWSWSSPPRSVAAAVEGIKACQAENPGNYVKAIAYDPSAQSRSMEVMLAPNADLGAVRSNGTVSTSISNGSASSSYSAPASRNGVLAVSKELDLGRVLDAALRQGQRLSLEIANPRQKACNSWRTWSWPHPPHSVNDAVASIEKCQSENPTSFIKAIAYDANTQSRSMEFILAPGKTPEVKMSSDRHGTAYRLPNANSMSLDGALAAVFQSGYRLSVEIANPRQKACNSWRTWSWPQQPHSAANAMSGVKQCQSENPTSYLKLVGYDPHTQTRSLERIIEPLQNGVARLAPAPAAASAPSSSASNNSGSYGSSQNWSSSKPSAAPSADVSRILDGPIRQGHRLSLEVANARQKARNSWRTWSWPSPPRTVADAIAGIRACQSEHPGSYVKVIAYNAKAQGRSLEHTIAP